MNANPLLAPAAILILWSMIVMLWMGATRLPAFTRAGLSLKKAPPGTRYTDVEQDMPEQINWVSHNYTHLMEQPTLFYAVTMLLVLAGEAGMVCLVAAWSYVVLRIIHSLWQIKVNTVLVRARLFALSSLCLLVLAVNGVLVTMKHYL